MDFENLKKTISELKVLKLLPNACDFQKENHKVWIKKSRKSIA
jgi:hypothetical protein